MSKSKSRDIDDILKMFNDNKDEIGNSIILISLFKRLKT